MTPLPPPLTTTMTSPRASRATVSVAALVRVVEEGWHGWHGDLVISIEKSLSFFLPSSPSSIFFSLPFLVNK